MRLSFKRIVYFIGFILITLILLVYSGFIDLIFASDSRIVHKDDFISVEYVYEEDIVDKVDINSRLLNLTDFQYRLEPSDSICLDNLFAVILVTSYVGHDQVRSAHRTAMTKFDLRLFNVARVFLLADIPSQEEFITQQSIENEHEHFNDIVQGNFLEAYRNLSYKHVMGLRWASHHRCLKPKFIIKMDDDIVVDFRQLFEYLQIIDKQSSATNENSKKYLLSGYVFGNVEPIRIRPSKWFVTDNEFRGNFYPNYLSGWMYVTTPYTAKSLVKASSEEKVNIFWIDDIWITGILREKQRIPITGTLNPIFSANSQFLDCCIKDLLRYRFQCPFIAGPNGGDHLLITKLSQSIQKQCYRNSNRPLHNSCSKRDPNLPSIKDTCVGIDKHLLQNDHGAAIVSAMKV